MVRLCGAVLGLFAFGATILLGLQAGNPTQVVLSRALWALLIFCVIGLCMGWVAYRVLDEHAIRKHREMFVEEESEDQATDAGGTDTKQQGKAPSAPRKQGASQARPAAAAR